MSLVVNHNMMSANTARILNQHYSRLNTSTQRLSSGLRINTAADDAAGLAIRELQRADIASLQQGARNANDAISLIQTADGALQVIDEKLIRMKELAEQAATGTYDSTQRLMIDSEYQAMASEITRIAKATDFNGIHLLNGNLASLVHDGSGMKSEGKMKIHFGTGNDSAEDYYYIQIKDSTAEAFSLGSNSTYENSVDRFANQMKEQLKGALKGKIGDGANGTITQDQYNKILASVDDLAAQLAGSGSVADQTVLDGRISNTDLKTNYGLPDNFAALSADDKQKLAYAFGRDEINKLASGETSVLDWMLYGGDASTTMDEINALGRALADITLDSSHPEIAARIQNAADAFADFENAYDAVYGTGSATGGSATAAGTLNPDQTGKTDGATFVYNQAVAALETAEQALVDAENALAPLEAYDAALQTINTLANGGANPENLTPEAIATFVEAVDAFIAADPDATAVPLIPAALRSAVEDYKAGGMGTGNVFRDALATEVKNAFDGNAHGVELSGRRDAVTAATDDIRDNKQPDRDAAQVALNAAKAALVGQEAVLENIPGVGNAEQYYTADPDTRRDMITQALALEQARLPGSEAAKIAGAVNAAARTAARDFIDIHDYDGMNIATQENAQIALDAINKAIVEKDKIRANLGSLQNRLENTISNLNIQAENLQAAESRISDVDVSTEMTEFVRNQILTQSAVAMLAQANSLPKMAMQLISG